MPPTPSAPAGGGGMRRSAFDKWKMGAVMGGSVGLIMGFIYGGYSIMKGGAGPNGPMRILGQYMLTSAITFGFFMSIGSVIRTEGSSLASTEAYALARRRPIVMTRQQARRAGK